LTTQDIVTEVVFDGIIFKMRNQDEKMSDVTGRVSKVCNML